MNQNTLLNINEKMCIKDTRNSQLHKRVDMPRIGNWSINTKSNRGYQLVVISSKFKLYNK